ncbi:hypothetical protein GGI15_003367, partial [Coemansia interrupta]
MRARVGDLVESVELCRGKREESPGGERLLLVVFEEGNARFERLEAFMGVGWQLSGGTSEHSRRGVEALVDERGSGRGERSI